MCFAFDYPDTLLINILIDFRHCHLISMHKLVVSDLMQII